MFATLGITVVQLEHFLLAFSRVGAMLFTMAFFSQAAVNGTWRFLLAGFLAYMAASITPAPDLLPVTFLELLPLAFLETLVGLSLGLLTNTIFAAVSFAGGIITQSMGLSMLETVDPVSGESNDTISQILNIFTVLFLLSADAHHYFLNVMFDSFYVVPLTRGVFSNQLLTLVVELLTKLCIVGIKLAAPVMVVLFLEKVVLALFAKISPELDVFVLSLATSILLGLWVLTYSWPYFNYQVLLANNEFGDIISKILKASSP